MTAHKVSPVEFCDRQARQFLQNTSLEMRKKRGQFFTAPSLAHFMAQLAPTRKASLKVLDPGAGAGILACAVCEKVAQKATFDSLELHAYESEPMLVPLLRDSLEYNKSWLHNQGIRFTYNIIQEDFILAAANILENKNSAAFDLAIANPPYFKINKKDQRAHVAASFVYGQPNIYALFMGMAAELLRERGLLVFITPRSYTAGPYFKAFRKTFFEKMSPERIHIFQSRRDAFRKDDVLQENIILLARKASTTSEAKISLSGGVDDARRRKPHNVPLSRALFRSNGDIILRLPTSHVDNAVLQIVDSWEGSLHKYGMEISTGPVVPFRARHLIPTENQHKKNLVPLLWMQNITPMAVRWPYIGTNGSKRKRQFLVNDAESKKRRLLVDDATLVLLRRFSAKEQPRRLTAAPLFKGQLNSSSIGIENHVNYIYRPGGSLTQAEALGLSALLNSSILDKYFRISNGNTQVSSTELRAMPLPAIDLLKKLGGRIKWLSPASRVEHLDELVCETVGVPKELLKTMRGLSVG